MTADGLPLAGADGHPVVLLDARTAYLLRDGLRRWANEHRTRGGGAKVVAVLPVLRAIEVAADSWAAHILAVPMSAGGRADAVRRSDGAPSDQHLDCEQTAALLGITARQVRRLAASEELPGERIAGVWMFDPQTVDNARRDRQQRSA